MNDKDYRESQLARKRAERKGGTTSSPSGISPLQNLPQRNSLKEELEDKEDKEEGD